MMRVEPQPTQEALDKVAQAFSQDLAKLALDIHKVADHIDGLGNRSVDTAVLRSRDLPVYFLAEEGKVIVDGLMFYNTDWEGWQVRKKPYWLDVWCQRFGKLEDDAITRIAGDWASIKAQREREAIEAARPKRETEEFEQGRWQDFDTDQIGQRMALACMMEHYFGGLRIRQAVRDDEGPGRALVAYMMLVVRQASLRCVSELKYRAAIGDMDAQGALDQGMFRYFTKDEFLQVERGDVLPWNLKPANPIPFAPKVVHVKSRLWIDCDPAERVYIGRNMQGFRDVGWGNPHKVGSDDTTRLEAIELYRQELLLDPVRLRKLDELRGKRVIGCWCKDAGRGYTQHWAENDKACHGDVLVELLRLPEAEFEKLLAHAEGEK